MIANLEAKTHLLYLEILSILLSLLKLLGPLIIVLSPVNNLGDWWVSIGGDLYQVQLSLLSQFEGLVAR